MSERASNAADEHTSGSRGIDVRTLTNARRGGGEPAGRSGRPGATCHGRGDGDDPLRHRRAVRGLHRRLPLVVAAAVALALVAQAVSIGADATVAAADPAVLRVLGVGADLDRVVAAGALTTIACGSVALAVAAYGAAVAVVRVAAA